RHRRAANLACNLAALNVGGCLLDAGIDLLADFRLLQVLDGLVHFLGEAVNAVLELFLQAHTLLALPGRAYRFAEALTQRRELGGEVLGGLVLLGPLVLRDLVLRAEPVRALVCHSQTLLIQYSSRIAATTLYAHAGAGLQAGAAYRLPTSPLTSAISRVTGISRGQAGVQL